MKSNSNDEVKELKKSLSDKEKEVEALKKNIKKEGMWLKVILPIIIVILSVFFFNKILNANKQIDMKDQKINKLYKELNLKTSKINELLNQINNDSNDNTQQINEINKNLKLRDQRIDEMTKYVDLKDEEIDELTKENTKLIESSYMSTIFFEAREGKSDVLYTTDEEMVKKVVSVAKETLSDDYGSCFQDKPEYDVYKNCFRDISIHLHNKLEIRYGPQWFVTSGRIANCFLITPVYPKHDEYFFTIGEIYFEIFKYEQNTLQDNSTVETEEDIENNPTEDIEEIQVEDIEHNKNVTNVENITIEKEKDSIVQNNSKVKQNAKIDEKVSENAKIDEKVSENAKIDEKVSENVKIDEKVSKNVKIDGKVSKNVKIGEKVSENVKIDGKVSENVKIDEKVSKNVKIDEKVSENVKIDEKVSENVKIDEKVSENVKIDEKVSENIVKREEKVAKTENDKKSANEEKAKKKVDSPPLKPSK